MEEIKKEMEENSNIKIVVHKEDTMENIAMNKNKEIPKIKVFTEEEKNKFSFHIDKKRAMVVGAILVLALTIGVSANSYNTLRGGEWLCIAQQCTDWLEGDDWVTQNCRPENNTLMCQVLTSDNHEVSVPLSSINTSQVRSCNQYSCVAEIYVRSSDELKREGKT